MFHSSAAVRPIRSRTAPIWALLVALLASACQPGLAPVPSATALPQSSASPASDGRMGLVLVALDGARSDWINSQLQSGAMPNLAALAQRGVMVNHLQPADPATTATTYLSLSTGTYPNQSGVVADRYHAQQGTFHELATPLAQVEPVWRTAMRNGLKTATLFWPGAALDAPETAADYVVTCASSDAPPAQHVISLQDATDWQTPPESFSPLREGSMRILSREGSTVAAFQTLLVDSTDDGVRNYDVLILANDKTSTNGRTELHLDRWMPAIVSPRLQSGAYLCLTACSGAAATLYSSQASYNQARPADLMNALNGNLGFPPPAPDVEALRAGWLSPQQYLEMAELRAKWMTDVVLYVFQSFHPDLLLTSQTVIADCARGFLLTDERQDGFTPEQATQDAAYLQQAHRMADANLGRLLEAVNLADSAVLVLSGQGLVPVHTTVRLNTILKNAGLLQLRVQDGQDQVDEVKSKALAFASGGSAHIYINLQGKERPGLVTPDDYAKVQQQIIRALQETQGDDGLPVFARILKREELKSVHLESPNSGDVFVQAEPGYAISDELGFKKSMVPASERTAGGFDATLPEMQGFLVAAGDGLLAGKALPLLHATDVATMVGQVLRLRLPNSSAGQAIEGIWR